MYGKINYANALEKEILSLFKGLEQSGRSILKLAMLFGRALKIVLGGLAKIAFNQPKLIRRLAPHKFEEVEGAARAHGFGLQRGPPNGPMF